MPTKDTTTSTTSTTTTPNPADAGDPSARRAKTDARAHDDDAGTRAGGTVTVNTADADIARITGTLADDASDHPEGQGGTVERTPIVGEPEDVVPEPADGLEDDAPRFGPTHARLEDEKATQT